MKLDWSFKWAECKTEVDREAAVTATTVVDAIADRCTETASGDATDTPTGDRWNKTQWVGDQGEGLPAPQDPDTMPEGENALSGDRHAPSEQHWADGQVEHERNT